MRCVAPAPRRGSMPLRPASNAAPAPATHLPASGRAPLRTSFPLRAPTQFLMRYAPHFIMHDLSWSPLTYDPASLWGAWAWSACAWALLVLPLSFQVLDSAAVAWSAWHAA